MGHAAAPGLAARAGLLDGVGEKGKKMAAPKGRRSKYLEV